MSCHPRPRISLSPFSSHPLRYRQCLDKISNRSGYSRTFQTTFERHFRSSQTCSTGLGPARLHLSANRGLDYHEAAAKTRQMFLLRRDIWTSILALREVSKPSIIIEFILGVDLGQLFKVELVPQHGADATEALDELVALARSVGDEFEGRAEVLVALGEPFEEGTLVDEFHFLARLLVREHLAVGFLALVGVQDDFGAGGGFQDPASDLQVLVHDQCLAGTGLHGFESVFDAVAYFSAVEANLVEVSPNELLLLYEFDVAEGFGCEFDGLIEPVLTTIGDIDYFDHLGLQAVVEHVGLVEIVLEVCRACEDQTGDVDFILGDVILHGKFGHLAHVVVAFLFPQTGETESGLTTSTVLLGKVDGELMNNISGVATECTKQSTVSVHDNEAKLLV